MKKKKNLKQKLAALLAAIMILCQLPIITGVAAPIGQNEGSKDLAVYFPNWSIHSDASKTVENLPWEQVTTINHAFWEVVPDQEREDFFKTYEGGMYADVWKVNGDTPYTIRPIEREADLGGELTPGGEEFAGHFAAYAKMCKSNPDVAVMLSIGGWSRTGMFSPMASTAESRAVFIESCIEVMKEYPWLAGIDIDWEYPSQASWAEWGRPGDIPTEQGCITTPQDAVNYTALITEMRAAFDEAFPSEHKQITICVQSSGWSVNGGGQLSEIGSAYEFDKIIEILDKINIMTYDHAGGWTGVAHHTSPHASEFENPWSTEQSIQFYATNKAWNSVNIKYPEKLNIGFAAYARAWYLDFEGIAAINKEPVDEEAFKALKQGDNLSFLMGDNAKKELAQWIQNGIGNGISDEDEAVYRADPTSYNSVVPAEQDIPLYYELCKFEADAKAGKENGWIYWLDESATAPLLTNNNPDSPYYGTIYSYDNLVSVAAKADLIDQYGMGGIILWATDGDATDGDSLIANMSGALRNLTMMYFDANDGSSSTHVFGKSGDALVLPGNPSLAGHIFQGWYTARTGGTKLTSDAVIPTVSTIYYAQWSKISTTTPGDTTTSGTTEGPKEESVPPLKLPVENREDGTQVTIVEGKGEYDFASTKVEGNLEISGNGAVIKNLELDADSELIINGKNVVIADSVIKGTVNIPGGTTKTVTLNGSKTPELVIEKAEAGATKRVRLNISKDSSVNKLYINAGAKLEITEAAAVQTAAVKYPVNNIYISVPAKEVVTLSGNYNNITLSSKNANIKLLEGKITKLTVTKEAVNPNLLLVKGTSITTLATTPKTASETLAYKSSNKKVAAVSQKGKVKSVKKGNATITVTNSNGKTVKCKKPLLAQWTCFSHQPLYLRQTVLCNEAIWDFEKLKPSISPLFQAVQKADFAKKQTN